MKKIVFIFLIVIGFTAYSQNIDRVEYTGTADTIQVNKIINMNGEGVFVPRVIIGVEADRYRFELDSVTADTIQVEIIGMNGKKVVVPGVIECKFDTTYDTYVQPWSGKSFVKMYVWPRYRIKIDLTGFKRGAYFIRLDENVFRTCKIETFEIES